jgi:hypothetical protein
MIQRHVQIGVAALALGISATLALTAPGRVAAQQEPSLKSDLSEGNPPLEKVSSDLLRARRSNRLGLSAPEVQAALPGVRFVDGAPEIEVRLRKLTPDIVEQVKAIGMQVTGVSYQYARLYGPCPLDRLDRIAAASRCRPRSASGASTSARAASSAAGRATPRSIPGT